MTKKLIQTVDNTITNPSFLSLYPRIITVLVPIVGWSEFSEAYLQSIECNGIPLNLETNFGYVFSFFANRIAAFQISLSPSSIIQGFSSMWYNSINRTLTFVKCEDIEVSIIWTNFNV